MNVDFDLNEHLAGTFAEWRLAYLPDASDDEARLYCAAYCEGARTVQALMQRAVIDVLKAGLKQ
jgi:hypothetical protein